MRQETAHILIARNRKPAGPNAIQQDQMHTAAAWRAMPCGSGAIRHEVTRASEILWAARQAYADGVLYVKLIYIHGIAMKGNEMGDPAA